MKLITILQWVKAMNPPVASRANAANAQFFPFPPIPFLLLSVFLFSFCANSQVNIPIGNLAPGETVSITFDVTLTNSFPAGVTAVTNQGTLTGSNFGAINSDDPQTFQTLDATVTVLEIAPAVTTLAATGITPIVARLNSSINPNNLATATWFEFGLTTNYGSFTPTNSLIATNILIATNAVLSNLPPGTLYHFRAVGTNAGGVTFGGDLSFTTIAIPPPVLDNLMIVSNGQFRFAFTNTAGQTFTVLAASNLTLPLSNWAVLGSAAEGPAGQFQFNDSQANTNTQRFYRVRWP